MSIHVAILHPRYLEDILAGTKTIESRFSMTRREPYGATNLGDRLFLKRSGGPFAGTAVATQVWFFDGLTPRQMDQIEAKHRTAIGGDDAYWAKKRHSRFATLIELDRPEPLDVGPVYKTQSMRAWYRLDDACSPLIEVALTPSNLKYMHCRLPDPQFNTAASRLAAKITLHLPHGETIETGYSRHHGTMLRWRGWSRVFRAQNLRPGDTLRYVRLAPGRYRVRCPGAPLTG